MIKYERFTLENGLRVIIHEDNSTPLVAMNILYNVGSRDEEPSKTGLAHLFEHLMFGGTAAIPDYDRHLQLAAGENNAFTNNDITDYYITLPAENIETGFWLESDRMNELDFSQKNLDTQRKVVIEEFRQRYLNQPYGDALLLLRPMAYKVHPYKWPTIGRDISHIEQTTLNDIRKFFYSHYAPNNAILSLSGRIDAGKAHKLASKWFGPIPAREVAHHNLPQEPLQTSPVSEVVHRVVVSDALYKVWHIGPRLSEDFHTLDLVTDLLAGGESGRLYTKLVKQKKLFSDINAYMTSDIDPGLVILHGKLMNGVSFEVAEAEVNRIIDSLKDKPIPAKELEKVKNKYEASSHFSNTSILNKAMNLAFCELLGDPELINRETEMFRAVSRKDVREASCRYFTGNNTTTLYYKSSRAN